MPERWRVKMSVAICTAVLWSQAVQVVSQSAQPASSPGLELLQKVARRYADAKQYLVESVEESTLSSENSRQWIRTTLVAAVEPGGRSHFEGRGQLGDAVQITDGSTVWKYHPFQHRYTLKPVDKRPEAAQSRPVPYSELSLITAKNLRNSLANSAGEFKSAERLPDAVLVVGGRRVSCAVVHMGRSDLLRTGSYGKFSRTIWIDKRAGTILKIVERSSRQVSYGFTQEDQTTKIYTRTVLDGPLAESLFAFSPPPDTHQVNELPGAMEEAQGTTMLGERIPPLKFKAADGIVTPIESLHGKTVIIDLWATWCAPCVAALPSLAQLADEGKQGGLAVILVDRDDDPGKAAAYLHQKGLTLTNFHDGDGQIETMLGYAPIPRDLMVDQAGWVVFDGIYDANKLRNRLAELNPAFKDLARPTQASPCVASK
jgi:thiol-disulfide isomerase/thioredoxin